MNSLDVNPPESYQLSFSIWLNKNHETLCKLWLSFLEETGSNKHDDGCSIDAFCWETFKQTHQGGKALAAINNNTPERKTK